MITLETQEVISPMTVHDSMTQRLFLALWMLTISPGLCRCIRAMWFRVRGGRKELVQ
jgi:hypothetical protein